MNSWSVSHLSDHVLLGEVTRLVSQERNHTATLLAHLGEVEARRLYAVPGYHSLHKWCVGELHLSRDSAYRRVRAAQAARRFPALFAAIADGRLHLTAVGLLDPYLTPANFEELVAAATHQDREAVELMLAHRFPRSDVPTEVQPLVAPAVAPLALATVAAGPVATGVPPSDAPANDAGPCSLGDQAVTDASGKVALAPLGPIGVEKLVPAATLTPVVYTTITPLSPGRFLLKGTLSQEALDALNEAKDLLAHHVPSGDLMHVLERVVEDWVAASRRRRQAAADNPRARRSAGNGRYVPAEVQRAVNKRDGDRCTYVSDSGRRCVKRSSLEFDHVVPVAKGGGTTVENLRLRCRAHNQLEAERMFGRQFMRDKRESARPSSEAHRAAKQREGEQERESTHERTNGRSAEAPQSLPPAMSGPA